MRRAALALFSAAALVAACTSFTSEGSPSSTTGPDASDDASSTDARADGPASPPDGAATTCADASAHDFCDDFDERSLAADGWQPAHQNDIDAGIAHLDMSQSKSAPSSLFATMSTVGFTTQRTFFLQQNLVKRAARKVVVAFDIYVDVLENAGGLAGDCLVAGIGDSAYTNNIRLGNQSGLLQFNIEEVQTGSGYYDPTYQFAGNGFAVKAWHHFELTSDRQTNTITFVVDGLAGARQGGGSTHVPPGTSDFLALSLGTQTDATGEKISVYFDNVTVDIDR